MYRNIFLTTLLCLLVSACSTRQAGERYSGSTEQRLVTYSIQDMAEQIKSEPLDELANQKVTVESYFLLKNHVTEYAEAKIATALTEEFGAEFVSTDKIDSSVNPAKYKLKLFFTSLGTDRDSAGLSIPLVDYSDPERSTSINILAVDMYHGISECEYYLMEIASGKIVQEGRLKARVRTDNFTTPFFSFPISDIDD